MSFPKLVFPMTVDFCSGGYWIGDIGPYKHGAATTALLRGDDLTGGADETKILTEQMEELLLTFGSHLNPYVMGQPMSTELFLWPEKAAANCSVCFAFHPVEGNAGAMAERWSISCLRDFLYIELGKAIQRGTRRGSAGCADSGFSTSRVTKRCIVIELPPAKRRRPAGKWAPGRFSRRRSRRRILGKFISGPIKNTTPGS